MRVRSLDSLRGAAAFVVVIHHCALCIKPEVFISWAQALHTKLDLQSILLALPFANGSGAVLVFFILSGLVLALSFLKNEDERYAPYVIKRISRIWLPFLAAICFSAGLQLLIQPHRSQLLNTWENGTWTHPLTWRVFFDHMTLVTGSGGELDTPMWSLVHEMRISLIFPAIAFAVKRRPLLAIGCSIAALAPARLLGHSHGDIASQCCNTLSYLFLFVIGAAAGVNLTRVRMTAAQCKGWLTPALWLLAFVLLSGTPFFNNGATWTKNIVYLILSGIAATIVVGLCTVENGVTRVLELPLPTWLGKISYSLYLIHVPILIATMRCIPNAPFLLKCFVAISVSLASAHFFNLLVERPAQKLGAKIAHSISVIIAPKPPFEQREAMMETP
jgi:peptidoglycan/LPS O-acetylase OafA/YrhL